ncbi:hypothetical protein Bca4012_032551 [Brassica carinata]
MKEKNSLPSFLNVPNAISSSTRNVSSYLQRLITHSFHPQHPLWLVKRESLPDQNGCMCCSLCGEQLMLLVYRCLICDFKLDMSCAKNPPLLEIDHPKVDQHKLHLLHLCCLRPAKKIKKARELENKPSKGGDDDYPFKIVEDEYIDHFTHEHYLAFHKDGKVSDVSKRFQACKLPVVYKPYFCCFKGCEFFLHEGCANLPRKKSSILHNHPLELDGKSTARTEFHAKHCCCSACGQFHDGFKYSCCDFNLDVGCASIPLPFKTSIHEHLLTIKSNSLQICSVCKLWASPVLSCGFHLGFDCAQLPKLARHKYDDHLLSLDFVKDETCEGARYLFSYEFEVVETSLAALRHCRICGLGCKGLEVIMSKGGGDKYLCSSTCLMRNHRLLKNL